MPKAYPGPPPRFRLQISGLMKRTRLDELKCRLEAEPAFEGQELSELRRLKVPTADGRNRDIAYVVVSGPPLARPLPHKLGMSQGTKLTTLWLVDKGDPGEGSGSAKSSRRNSPYASPSGSPKSKSKSVRGTRSPAPAQEQQVSPMLLPAAPPLADRAFAASQSPPTVNRFRSIFQSADAGMTPGMADSVAVEPITFSPSPPSAQEQAWGAAPAWNEQTSSPDWPSYLNRSPSYSISPVTDIGQSYLYDAPVVTQAAPQASSNGEEAQSTHALPQRPLIPYTDPLTSFAHLGDEEAINQLTTLLAQCMPFLHSPENQQWQGIREEATRNAWGDEVFRAGVRDWEMELDRCEAAIAR